MRTAQIGPDLRLIQTVNCSLQQEEWEEKKTEKKSENKMGTVDVMSYKILST